MNPFRFFFILCGLTLIMTAAAFAQPDSLWSRTFGGSGEDVCYSVLQAADGGYILAGSTTSYGAGGCDFWLVKTDANGALLWSRTFGGFYDDGCLSATPTSDGGYLLAGYTCSSDAAESADSWIVKTNANGDSLWSRTYGRYIPESFHSVAQTFDGGYIFAGNVGFYTDTDFWLVKTDSNGDTLWCQTYGGDLPDYGTSVIQTSDSNFILAGYSYSFGYGWLPDLWVLKIDSDGDTLWNRYFVSTFYELGYCAAATSDSGCIIGGYRGYYNPGQSWLVKMDTNGSQLWTRSFGGSGEEWCNAVQPTPDSGYILVGYSESLGGEFQTGDFWVIKTDANGDGLWSRTLGGSEQDECHAVVQTSDSGFVLAGYTKSFGEGDADFWMIKLGESDSAKPLENPLPAEHTLYQNYPNPFNPSTQISFDLTKANHLSLKVFDLLGREIATLVDDIRPAGNHSVTFDGSKLPSGIYFSRLQAGEFVATKKMVLLK